MMGNDFYPFSIDAMHVFNCYRTPAYPERGKKITLSDFSRPYTANSVQFSDQQLKNCCFRFCPTGSGNTVQLYLLTADGKPAYGSDGKVRQGKIYGLSNIGFLFVGSDYYGYFFDIKHSYGYGESVSYVPKDGETPKDVLDCFLRWSDTTWVQELADLRSKWRGGKAEDAESMYLFMKRLDKVSPMWKNTAIYKMARDCADALDDEMYLTPLRGMGPDAADYEIQLGKTAGMAADPLFKLMSSAGLFRNGCLPRTARKCLRGIDYYTVLYECYKLLYIHTLDFKTAVMFFDMPVNINPELTFDPKWYLEHNEDLAAVFGSDTSLAESHFSMFGAYEYRDSSPVFDPLYYARKNNLDKPCIDIYRIFGTSTNPANTSPCFDITAYKAAYPGMEDVLKTDKEWIHSYLYRLRPPTVVPRLNVTCSYISKINTICGLKMSITDAQGLSIQYKINTGSSWSGTWIDGGEQAGTVSSQTAIQGVMIRLTGAQSAVFDVVYRVKTLCAGTLGWARNGQMSGSSSLKLPFTAIDVKLVTKKEANDLISQNSIPAYIDGKILTARLFMNALHH